MTRNVGGIERAIRIVGGLAILSLLYFLEGNARWWGLIGLVPLLTGLLAWCPAWSMFGVNTCPIAKPKA